MSSPASGAFVPMEASSSQSAGPAAPPLDPPEPAPEPAATGTPAPAQTPPERTNPIVERAKMNFREYRRSSYFAEDHRRFIGGALAVPRFFIIYSALAVLAVFIWFSLPPQDARMRMDSLEDVVAAIASYGGLLVFFLAFFAMRYARNALSEIGVNAAIARCVETTAGSELEAIRNSGPRGSLADLPSRHLPANPSYPKPAALRLFQRICDEAKDRKFESAVNLIEPYQRESMESVLRLESVQKAALRFGILCHFVGLVLVINSVPAVLNRAAPSAETLTPQVIAPEGAPAAAANSPAIREILDGLRLAFGASVGGLAVSLFAALLLGEVRQKQFAYFRKLDEAASTMLSLAANSWNDSDLVASLAIMSKRLQDQSEVIKLGINQVAHTISEQSGAISDGLKGLRNGRSQLDEFLKGLADGNAEFLRTMNLHQEEYVKQLHAHHDDFLKNLNSHYDVASMNTLVQGVESRISQKIRDVGSPLAVSAQQTAGKLDKVQNELSDVRIAIAKGEQSAPSQQPTAAMMRTFRWATVVIAGASLVNLIVYVVRG